MQRSDTLSWLPPLPSQAPYLRSATVNLAPSSYMALRAIHRIGSLLLSDMSSHADLASQIARIEDALSLHAAALHIALNALRAGVRRARRRSGAGNANAMGCDSDCHTYDYVYGCVEVYVRPRRRSPQTLRLRSVSVHYLSLTNT